MADLNTMKKISVAVIGASGYAGLELVRLLVRHPGCELVALTSREWAGQPFSQVFPALAGICDLPFEAPDPEAIAARADVVFTSVPHQTAMEVVPPLLAAGLPGGGPERRFPLPGRQAVYEAWYQPHSAPALLAEAVYGLPELHARSHQPGPPGGQPRLLPHLRHPGVGPSGGGQTGPAELSDCRLQVREPAAPAARRRWPPSTAKSTRASGPIRWRSTATTRRWSRN